MKAPEPLPVYEFSAEEMEKLQPAINVAVDIIKSFVLAGIDITMNQYNKLGKGKEVKKLRS